MANDREDRAMRAWDMDALERRPPARGTTPDERPPYRASNGPGDYDPAANWAAERRGQWGPLASSGLGGFGMEGAPSINRVGGFGPEGDYGEFGRGAAHYGTAPVVAGAGTARRETGHAGRGPRNWRRSDERITEDVNEALTRDPHLDATGIDVQVKDGEVTLLGSVEDRFSKRRAEDDALACSGVRDVHNRLIIVP